MQSMFIDYLSSNLFENNLDATTLYVAKFGKLPSRAVFQQLTKPFCTEFLALFPELKVEFRDFGCNSKDFNEVYKTIYIDKLNEVLIIEVISDKDICYVLHFSNMESNLALVDAAIKLAKKHQIPPVKRPKDPMIELVVTSQGELVTVRHKFAFKPLTNEELVIHYGKDFLPIYDKLKEFLDTHRKLVLLHGPPGVGKSTLLKQLVSLKNEHLLYFSPENIKLLGTPEFTKFMIQHTGKVIIAEDAENVLVDAGSRSSATANLLNLTDGILAEIYDCGLLATFNTHISQLDNALLRPGRLFLQHELRALTVEESNNFLEYKKSPLRVESEKTLAELFSMLEPEEL